MKTKAFIEIFPLRQTFLLKFHVCTSLIPKGLHSLIPLIPKGLHHLTEVVYKDKSLYQCFMSYTNFYDK